jgi:hypothetical protein
MDREAIFFLIGGIIGGMFLVGMSTFVTIGAFMIAIWFPLFYAAGVVLRRTGGNTKADIEIIAIMMPIGLVVAMIFDPMGLGIGAWFLASIAEAIAVPFGYAMYMTAEKL